MGRRREGRGERLDEIGDNQGRGNEFEHKEKETGEVVRVGVNKYTEPDRRGGGEVMPPRTSP